MEKTSGSWGGFWKQRRKERERLQYEGKLGLDVDNPVPNPVGSVGGLPPKMQEQLEHVPKAPTSSWHDEEQKRDEKERLQHRKRREQARNKSLQAELDEEAASEGALTDRSKGQFSYRSINGRTTQRTVASVNSVGRSLKDRILNDNNDFGEGIEISTRANFYRKMMVESVDVSGESAERRVKDPDWISQEAWIEGLRVHERVAVEHGCESASEYSASANYLTNVAQSTIWVQATIEDSLRDKLGVQPARDEYSGPQLLEDWTERQKLLSDHAGMSAEERAAHQKRRNDYGDVVRKQLAEETARRNANGTARAWVPPAQREHQSAVEALAVKEREQKTRSRPASPTKEALPGVHQPGQMGREAKPGSPEDRGLERSMTSVALEADVKAKANPTGAQGGKGGPASKRPKKKGKKGEKDEGTAAAPSDAPTRPRLPDDADLFVFLSQCLGFRDHPQTYMA